MASNVTLPGGSMRSQGPGPSFAGSGHLRSLSGLPSDGEESPEAMAHWQTMVDSGWITDQVQVHISKLLDLPREFRDGRPLRYNLLASDEEKVLGKLEKLGGKAPAQEKKETFSLSEEGMLRLATRSVGILIELQYEDGRRIARCSLSRMDPRSAKPNTYSCWENEGSDVPICGVELTIFEGAQELEKTTLPERAAPTSSPRGPPADFPPGAGQSQSQPSKEPTSQDISFDPPPLARSGVPPPPPLPTPGMPALGREVAVKVSRLLDVPSRPQKNYVVRVLDPLGQLAATPEMPSEAGGAAVSTVHLGPEGDLALRTESPLLTVRVEFSDGLLIGSCQIYRPDPRSEKMSQYLLTDAAGGSADCGVELQVLEAVKASRHMGGNLPAGSRVVEPPACPFATILLGWAWMGCSSSSGLAPAKPVKPVTGLRKHAGVHDLRRCHRGGVQLQNQTTEDLQVRFAEPNLLGGSLQVLDLPAGESLTFDPGESWNFDFHLSVNEKLRAHVVRGGSYSVKRSDSTWSLETLSLPKRQGSERLSNLKGLSFSFSASGWLVIYQLGVAECLQNHGIAKNPYVRVSGASGGALAACIMMYGADPRKPLEVLLQSAQILHARPEKAFLLRKFVLKAMQEILQDGSFQHPVFESRRLEIGVSSTQNKGPGRFINMMLNGREHRLKNFSSTADVAVALLASSTCGISGLPFTFHDEEGEERQVADGAFKNFLPTLDENSITVKPFCAGVDVLKLTGQRADIGPSEFVPGSFGVFPPPPTLLQHLYELGYRDTETWLQLHLEERLRDVAKTAEAEADLPPVAFSCENEGMLWHKEVLQRVPVKWADMLNSRNFLADKTPQIRRQGMLELADLSFVGFDGQTAEAAPWEVTGVRRWMVLTELDMRWQESEKENADLSHDEDQQRVEWMIQELQVPSVSAGSKQGSQEAFLRRLTCGRVHLSWISDAYIDEHCRRCSVDTPERHFVVSTVNYSLTLRAASHEDAIAWTTALQASKTGEVSLVALFTFPVGAEDGELELKVMNSSVPANQVLGSLGLALWNVPPAQWLQRREKLVGGPGELEYAFFFQPAKVSTEVPQPGTAPKAMPEAPPAPPSGLAGPTAGSYGGPALIAPLHFGPQIPFGEPPPGSMVAGDLVLPPLTAGWEAFKPVPRAPQALRSLPAPPTKEEPRMEEHQALFPDMFHYEKDEHEAEELWLKPPEHDKADELLGADRDFEVFPRKAEKWRAPVLTPVQLDVFHDKVFPDMDVSLVLPQQAKKELMPAREVKTRRKERRDRGLPEIPVDGWDNAQSKQTRQPLALRQLKDQERKQTPPPQGGQQEPKTKWISPILEARSKRRRAKLKVERELVRPEQALDIDQQLQSPEMLCLDPALQPQQYKAQVVSHLEPEDEERRVWVRRPGSDPTVMEALHRNKTTNPCNPVADSLSCCKH
ncbi:PNPLA2 [Symbiodinium necroappetens]|uniref:PNPLA2 protein n=1 Tax=Symbiodinium necroappetens TaxID=1628268 RepID=A0A813BIU1_9DINO|nr:PNPLA2 [Symbiodinium necroappetens]